jgi:hypothetical protein
LLGIRRFAADGSVVFNFDDNDGTRVGLTAFNLDEGEYGVLWSDNVVRAYDDAQSQLWDFSDMNVTVSYVVSDPGADAVYIVGSANGDAYYQQRDLAGAFRWEETVTGTSCAGVAPVSGDGALITCGSTLIRVDSSGAQMFTAAVPAAGIRARGDGTFVGVDGDRVVGFDADGTETWSAAEGPELLVGPVAADESGATVVFAPEGDGIRLAKLSPQGELWWTQLVESADTVRVNALDVGADGMIVLAGRAEIDPTHSEKWVAAFAP